MNEKERNELRELQNKYLALPYVKRAASSAICFENHPIVTKLDVERGLWPQLRYSFQWAIDDYQE